MLATLLIALALLAQSPKDAKEKTPAPVEPLRLTGCVSKTPAKGGGYTFTSGAETYRLTGKDLKKYAGLKVEVVEALVKEKSKGFAVKGGLYPSPNVAGQAGALDPVQAGIATQPGSGVAAGTGGDLPEFRVNTVKLVDGACE